VGGRAGGSNYFLKVLCIYSIVTIAVRDFFGALNFFGMFYLEIAKSVVS
jgi:hypothetical protein